MPPALDSVVAVGDGEAEAAVGPVGVGVAAASGRATITSSSPAVPTSAMATAWRRVGDPMIVRGVPLRASTPW